MTFRPYFVLYLASALYGCALVYAYNILELEWAYFGYVHRLNYDTVPYAAAFVAALPSLLLRRNISRIVNVIAVLIYVIVFIPCMLMPIIQQYVSLAHSALIFGSVFVSSVIFLLICRIRLAPLSTPSVAPNSFWLWFWLAYVVLTGFVLFVARGHISIADFGDVYDQRQEAGVAVSGAGKLAVYAIGFLSYGLNPFLLAFGLQTRRWGYVAGGILGQVFMFATLALRSTLASPLLIISMWLLIGRRGTNATLKVVGAVAILAIALLPLMNGYHNGPGFDQILTFLYMRTLTISGVSFGVYENVFSMYPHTYLSHSSIGRIFFHYPYGNLELGQVVGQWLAPSFRQFGLDYNANFLATDGIAGFGLIGVPFVAAILAVVLVLAGRLAPLARTRLAAAAAVPFVVNLSNTSLFQSMMGGGGIVLFAILFLSDQTVEAGIVKAAERRVQSKDRRPLRAPLIRQFQRGTTEP